MAAAADFPDKAGGRPLVLCADDYGLAPGVSRGILELVAAGRISAVSCMSLSRFWPEHAAWLRPLSDRAEVGLHLTLTGLPPLGPMPGLAPDGRLPQLGRLMRDAYLRRLPLSEIAAELGRQLDAFERHFGRPPAFLDGHQHVHQLPGVRDLVLDLYRRRLAGARAWVRCCGEPLPAILRRGIEPLKSAVIALQGRRLARRLRAAGIPANGSFRGVYGFAGDYGALFSRFLAGQGARPLIMCHPGHVDAELAAVDSVTVQREVEWRYFRSDSFPTALAAAGYRLAPFAGS